MEGFGQYNFIPCPGFIGTIFVNCLSNILCTMAAKCELQFEFHNGAKIEEVKGGLTLLDNNSIKVGDVKFGQFRDIMLRMRFPEDRTKPYMSVKLKYYDYVNKQWRMGSVEQQTRLENDDPLVAAHICRVRFIDEVTSAVALMRDGNMNNAQNTI